MAFASKEQNDSRYLSQPNDIKQCFKRLRDDRVELTLTMEDGGDRITCTVLDITPRSVLIEDIKPRNALTLLKKRPKFSLSARDQGVFAFIEKSQITGEGEERGLPYFHIDLPHQMLFQQRRRAARFRLPKRVTSQGAHITLTGDRILNGRIIDISAGGCRASFDFELEAHALKINQVFDHCVIHLPPVLEVQAQGIIRHCHKQRTGATVAGIELSEMRISDRRRLEQFIKSLSRSSDSI